MDTDIDDADDKIEDVVRLVVFVEPVAAVILYENLFVDGDSKTFNEPLNFRLVIHNVTVCFGWNVVDNDMINIDNGELVIYLPFSASCFFAKY